MPLASTWGSTLGISDIDVFHPTVMFGFMSDHTGKEVLCQMWVNALGIAEYRPVPMVKVSEGRKPSVAGYLEEDDERAEDY